MNVRPEKPEDAAAVRKVNMAAFDRENEANLVDRLGGLGPVAVIPNYQRQGQGIGSLLLREGLKECGRSGFQAVVAIANPDFYSISATGSSKSLKCESQPLVAHLPWVRQRLRDGFWYVVVEDVEESLQAIENRH